MSSPRWDCLFKTHPGWEQLKALALWRRSLANTKQLLSIGPGCSPGPFPPQNPAPPVLAIPHPRWQLQQKSKALKGGICWLPCPRSLSPIALGETSWQSVLGMLTTFTVLMLFITSENRMYKHEIPTKFLQNEESVFHFVKRNTNFKVY